MARRVHESIEVQVPKDEAFAYWADFGNFPKFMNNVEEVQTTGQGMSRWRVKGPLGKTVEFDARTTELDPERGIGWNSVDGDVQTSGEVRFEEVLPDRTRVEVTMNYADPPGGKLGEVVADAISNPERIVREDLENFARLVEGR